MINSDDVFEAVRRGYDDLADMSDADIVHYFDGVDADCIGGHVSNVKGILFEQEYIELLVSQNIDAAIFEATNHPVTDISIMDNGEVINELQLKATDSVSYINATLNANPDIEIVTTSEVASRFDTPMVIDSGIEDEVLESVVFETLTEDIVNPLSPLSVVSWLVGLPF